MAERLHRHTNMVSRAHACKVCRSHTKELFALVCSGFLIEHRDGERADTQIYDGVRRNRVLSGTHGRLHGDEAGKAKYGCWEALEGVKRIKQSSTFLSNSSTSFIASAQASSSRIERAISIKICETSRGQMIQMLLTTYLDCSWLTRLDIIHKISTIVILSSTDRIVLAPELITILASHGSP